MADNCYHFLKKMVFFIYFTINIIVVFSIKSNVQRIQDIPISGNRSIEECINGKPFWESKSELFNTTSQLIRSLGYPAEEHVILTEDGYLLTMHRIPGAIGAPPVFLQHGIGSSSFDYVVAGKDYALALILADKGYDVWMGNSRGNTYSQCHTKFTTSEYSYWNFSWHEMGIYDLPTEIAYVKNLTNQNLIYIGHSMGTTMFYVMAIEKPDTASKIKAMFALSSVSYISHMKSLLRLFAPFTQQLEMYAKISSGSLLTQRPLINIKYLPAHYLAFSEKFLITNVFLLLIGGFDTAYSDLNVLQQIIYHTPAGSSLKAMIHHLQGMNSGRFQYYDYGTEGNLKVYNTSAAPDYELSKIKVPIAVFWSDTDIVSKIDAEKLYNEVSNKIIMYKVEAPVFSHVDYLWGKRPSKFLYPKLLSIIENYV